jgi:exonuclease III
MNSNIYKEKYFKYKNKYINLKENIKTIGGGLGLTEDSQTVIKDLQPFSIPFDKSIFTDLPFIHDYNVFSNVSAYDEKAIIEQIRRDISTIKKKTKSKIDFNNLDHIEGFKKYLYSDFSEKNNLITFLKKAVSHYETLFMQQIDDNKISDHSLIFYTINDINIASLNLLDDTYTILTMFFAQLPLVFKHLYTYALTIALNNIREKRITKIVKLLVHTNPDIICFQEANMVMLEILIKQLAYYGFNMHNKNEVVDNYIHKGKTMYRKQYRSIFYKKKMDELPLPYGEINFTNKSQSYLIYNNILIVSLHISWTLNLNLPDKVSEEQAIIKQKTSFNMLGIFIKDIIILAKSFKQHDINKIVLIGDTNNSALNLDKALKYSMDTQIFENIQFTIHESCKPTFYIELNGSDKIDNLIEITLD